MPHLASMFLHFPANEVERQPRATTPHSRAASKNPTQPRSRGPRFGVIAEAEVESMRALIGAGRGKRTYVDYIEAAERYLIPFFGQRQISELSGELIDAFDSWRISQLGRVPKQSTQRNHASAFARVVARLRREGHWDERLPLPRLNVGGARSEARPAFSDEEVERLLAFMPQWAEQGPRSGSEVMRRLCWSYVEFLLYTGMRTGTEALNVRWQHLQWHHSGGERFLKIWVSGKTGPRELIARREVLPCLERLIQWGAPERHSVEDMLARPLQRYVFVLPTGRRPHMFVGIFSRLMRDSGLQKDASGRLNRSLYSLRHTYATQALARGVDIHTLARQMGTSVAMLEKHYSKLTPMLAAGKLA